ncbi:MAG: RidA family protein [Planctomycetes bacterium]|nr:RidA family protein [Planctomycetota bacterium]
MNPLERLEAMGLSLPAVARPVGAYVPAVRVGDQVVTSGQLPMRDGQLIWSGKIPRDVSVEQGQEAARVAALNALAAAASVGGGLESIIRIVRVNVFVNSADGFTDQPKIANGASDLLVEILGENGRHTRAAVGVAELPLNASVELDLIVQVKSA